MKILHITPHLGGGVGTVIIDWMVKIRGKDNAVLCLDTMNDKAKDALGKLKMAHGWNQRYMYEAINRFITESDVVLVHYWDHPMLEKWLAGDLPECRLAFWCHKNFSIPDRDLMYPDRFIGTSWIQDVSEHIWSTGNMERFLKIKPKPHEGFNIGYAGTVDYKKLHPEFLDICKKIKRKIPEAHFAIVGEDKISGLGSGISAIDPDFTFTGKIDDVAPFLAEMDVFAYPLRPDHYGTCEIALGEAMAAGVVPIVMDNPAERVICGPVGAKSETEFIRMVEMLYQVPEFRQCLSPMVRDNARRIYSIGHMIATWEQVFQEMMQKPKTKHGRIGK